MVLKLDRQYPLVWRSPNSLQLGVDHSLLVIDGVTRAEEQLFAALAAGISRSGLDMIARTVDARPGEVGRLLSRVAAALEREPDAPATATIEGTGPTADALRLLLGVDDGADEGADEMAADNPGFVVIIAHHVIEPELHGRWLRRDVPHLPVVFGDSLVRIGPIVEPGTGPCLYCLALHRTDADPAWPAIASQLWGRPSTLESTLVANEIASIVARLVQARQLRGTPGPATSIELDAATGERVSRSWVRHPDCQCAGITEAQPETGMASVPPNDPIPFLPRTGAANGALA